MNLLDENIRRDQAVLLQKFRIKIRFITTDIAHFGIQDPDIIPLLHHLKRPTFFTHDKDYFHRSLAHQSYCLVWLDVFDGTAAACIRRFLRHPDFRTQSQREGKVIRLHSGGLQYWQLEHRLLFSVPWPRK